MMWHGIVGKAEKHAIYQLWSYVFGGVSFDQDNVPPLLAAAQPSRLVEHACRQVDAVDASIGSEHLLQKGKIPSRSTSHLQHAVALLKPQQMHRMFAQT